MYQQVPAQGYGTPSNRQTLPPSPALPQQMSVSVMQQSQVPHPQQHHPQQHPQQQYQQMHNSGMPQQSAKQNQVYPVDQSQAAPLYELNTATGVSPQAAKSPAKRRGRNSSTVISQRSEVELINDHDFDRADIALAEKHRDLLAFTTKADNGVLQEYPLCVDNDEIGKYGIGLELYFKLLKAGAITFLLLSLVATASIYSNYNANGLKTNQIKSFYDQYSFGNQVQINSSTSTSLSQAQLDTVTQQVYDTMIPDIIYSVMFFLFIAYMRWTTRSLIKENEEDVISVSDYALEVKGFPETGVTPQELADFFGQFGPTVEVQIARDYKETLHLFQDLAEYEVEKGVEQSRINLDPSRDKEDLATIEKNIQATKVKIFQEMKEHKENFASHNDYPAVKAFVIFENITDRNKTIRKLEDAADDGACWCFCPREHYKKHIFREKHQLIVKIPDEPSNIIWENLGTTIWQRRRRSLAAYFIILLILIITFIINMFASFFSDTSTDACSDYSSLSDSQLTALNVTAIKTNSTALSCFCQSISYTALVQNSADWDACWSYQEQKAASYAINAIGGIVPVIVNIILVIVFEKLGNFRRFLTETERMGSVITNTFVAQFVNMAVIPIIAFGNFNGVVPTLSLLQSTIPSLANVNGNGTDYSRFPNDFNRSWYLDVGSKIMSTMLFNIFSPHLLLWLALPFIKCCRRRNEDHVQLQKDLNAMYDNPVFQFRYPQVLCTIFVCLTFSSGMPLILVFGFSALFLLYWTEKYKVLRYASRPPYYNASLGERLNKMLPFALILHLVIAIGQYGTDAIFPVNIFSSSFSISSYSSYTSLISSGSYNVSTMISKTVILFVILLIVSVLFVVDVIIVSLFRAILRVFCYVCLCGCFCQKKAAEDEIDIDYEHQKQNATFSEEYVSRLQYYGLCTYDIMRNEKYRPIIQAMESIGGGQDLETLHIERGKKATMKDNLVAGM